jgi:hypothetical protein
MRLVVAAPLLLTACVHASPPLRSVQEDAIRAQVATLERAVQRFAQCGRGSGEEEIPTGGLQSLLT